MALFDRLREIVQGFGARIGFGSRSTVAEAQLAADLVYDRWARLADSAFHKTREAYKSAMRIDVKPGVIVLRLEGKFPNMLEWGAPAWDLRQSLLKEEGSPWPKRNKRGQLYRPIFFRVASAQIAQWGGRSAYRKQAISLDASIRRPGRPTEWGSKLPKGLTEGRLPAGQKRDRLKASHATDPLHGLYRLKEGPGGKSYYGTFRTISWGSKPWTHPGFKGKRLMKQAIKRLGSNVIAKVRRG